MYLSSDGDKLLLKYNTYSSTLTPTTTVHLYGSSYNKQWIVNFAPNMEQELVMPDIKEFAGTGEISVTLSGQGLLPYESDRRKIYRGTAKIITY